MNRPYIQKPGKDYLRSLRIGFVSGLLFLLLLLLSAAVGDRFECVMERKTLTAGMCLLVCSLICGAASAKKAGQGKLLHALTAEAVILAVLIVSVCMTGAEVRIGRLLIDAAVMLFGAFAGTMVRGKKKRKQKGKK